MSLKIFIVTRNQPQHFAVIDAIQDTKTLCGGVIQRDINQYMKAPHLKPLIEAEQKSIARYFGIKYSHMSNVKTIAIESCNMNDDTTIDFINSQEPDIVLFFDAEEITNENLNKINAKKWQLFLGNPELNRGYFSNFLANFHKMPEQTVVTLLEMNDNSNSGNIIHQTSAKLRDVDSTTDLEYRSMRIMLNDIPEIVTKEATKTLVTKKQSNTSAYNNPDVVTQDIINEMFSKYNNQVYKYLSDNHKKTSSIQLFMDNVPI